MTPPPATPLTLGLYAQAVVSFGAAAAESMAARFRLPGAEAPREQVGGDARCRHGAPGVRRAAGDPELALDHEMIGRTPCRRIKLPEVTPVRRHIVDGEELGRLAAAMGGVEGYGTMAYLGTVDGLRWGEVAGLRVGQFDFQSGNGPDHADRRPWQAGQDGVR